MITLIKILCWNSAKYTLAKKTLIYETNFNLPESTQSDVLILLRVLIRLIRQVFKKQEKAFEVKKAMVVGLGESKENKTSHQTFNQVNNLPAFHLHLDYESILTHLSLMNVLQLCLIMFSSLPLLLIPSVFSKRRASYAICLLYACQVSLLVKRLKDLETQLLIDYSAYYNQSNWLSIVAMDLGIKVVKVPSIVPLAGHFKHVISTKLWLSNPYHLDEVNAIKTLHIVDEYIHGMPKHAEYLNKYLGRKIEPTPLVIGYYSHASWIRVKQGDAHSEFGLPEMEEKLLRYIADYCNNRVGVKLHIFTHPRERSEAYISSTQTYYRDCIPDNVDYELYTGNEKSSLSFESAEIGVGTMSSILFERLLCGYKTLFYSEGMISFPVPGAAIRDICVNNNEQLFAKVDQLFGQKHLEVFRSFKYDSEFYKSDNEL